MKRLLLPLGTVAVLLLEPATASAFANGRFDQSGKTPQQSCLACHGSLQYDGLKFRLEGVETASCSVDRNGQVEEVTLPKLSFGEKVPAVIEIPTPSGNTVPQCPTNDCCSVDDPPTANDTVDLACVDRGVQREICGGGSYFECCAPGLTECGEPVAGFNAEIVGGGAFDVLTRDCGTDRLCEGDFGYSAPDADNTEGDGTLDTPDQTKLLRQGTVDVPTQATHVRPRPFVDGSASWKMFYVAPSKEEAASSPRIYVGANVANGNALEDPLDLNSNYVVDVVLSDGATEIYPDYCLVCSDGSLAVNGSCCTCVQATPGAGTLGFLGALSALGFLLLGRRRRR